MAKRKDALFAASKAICYLHEAIDALQIEDLVYTTGEIICHPCVHSCVPDEVEISIDVRHKDAESLQKAENGQGVPVQYSRRGIVIRYTGIKNW